MAINPTERHRNPVMKPKQMTMRTYHLLILKRSPKGLQEPRPPPDPSANGLVQLDNTSTYPMQTTGPVPALPSVGESTQIADSEEVFTIKALFPTGKLSTKQNAVTEQLMWRFLYIIIGHNRNGQLVGIREEKL